jgi:hypothetical protein
MFTLQTILEPFLLKGRGEKNPLVEVTVNSKEENSFVTIMSKNSASGYTVSGVVVDFITLKTH